MNESEQIKILKEAITKLTTEVSTLKNEIVYLKVDKDAQSKNIDMLQDFARDVKDTDHFNSEMYVRSNHLEGELLKLKTDISYVRQDINEIHNKLNVSNIKFIARKE